MFKIISERSQAEIYEDYTGTIKIAHKKNITWSWIEVLIVCFIGTTHSKCSIFDRNVKLVDMKFSLHFIKSYLSKSSPIALWKSMHGKASFIQLFSKSPLLLPIPPAFSENHKYTACLFQKEPSWIKKKQQHNFILTAWFFQTKTFLKYCASLH